MVSMLPVMIWLLQRSNRLRRRLFWVLPRSNRRGFHPNFAVPPVEEDHLNGHRHLDRLFFSLTTKGRDETLLSWNVPLRGSGKTTHSEGTIGRGRDNAGAPLHRVGVDHTSCWRHSAPAGTIPIRSIPSSRGI